MPVFAHGIRWVPRGNPGASWASCKILTVCISPAIWCDLRTTCLASPSLRVTGFSFPSLPAVAAPSPAAFIPSQVVATGAGAGLVLDFVAYVRSRKLVPARPAKVVYSTASLPLLQFVTDSLLAERIPGLDIKTALTRHEDLQVRTTMPRRLSRCFYPKRGLQSETGDFPTHRRRKAPNKVVQP